MTQHMERPTEAIEHLRECASHDTCEMEGCEYWIPLEEIEKVVAYIDILEVSCRGNEKAATDETIEADGAEARFADEVSVYDPESIGKA